VSASFRLLLADDEPLELEALRVFAVAHGAFSEIREATNGRSAVEAAVSFRPDVIALDIRMPGMDGLEAARAIRGFDQRARIVFLTAFGELDYARAAFKVRADDFVLKPVSEDAFREAMDRAILALREAGATVGTAAGTAAGAAAGGRQAEGRGGAFGVRNAERALMEAILRGAEQDAADLARRAFDASAQAGTDLQESRRVARAIVALLERELFSEFGRKFESAAAVEAALSRSRDRGEVIQALADSARAFARETGALKADPHRKAVEAALAFIEANWRNQISLEEASGAAGLSRFHFSRVFRAATGSTFTDYVCAKRVERAKELLADGELPIKKICDLAGFSDPAYFASAFRKREGLSPSEYRTLIARRGSARLLSK